MSITFWNDTAHIMGLGKKGDPVEELNILRKLQGFLPATVNTYDAPCPSSILYERPSGYSFTYTLKPEFTNLKHTDPYKAPHDMRLAHVRALAKKMCDEYGIDLSELC